MNSGSNRDSSDFLTGRRLPVERLSGGKASPVFLFSAESDAEDAAKGGSADEKEAAFSGDASERSVRSVAGPLTVFRRRAMAGDFEIALNDPAALSGAFSGGDPADAALSGLDEVDRVEELLSVFRPTSPVSRVNRLAAEMNVRVPEELFALVCACRDYWSATDGAFDITISPLWEAWGFARRDGRLPSKEELQTALAAVGMPHLLLDAERCALGFDRPGAAINFGGIGKGYALDCAAEKMERLGLVDFLAQGGQSSVLARGGRRGESLPDGAPAWSVGVVHPLRPSERLGVIRLSDAALSTSGSQRQFFIHRSRRLSHLIDPRTGQPATGVLSVTVVAKNAARADALATAFFVMGPEKTEEYCLRNPEISALFVLEKQNGSDIELYPIQMSEPLFTVAPCRRESIRRRDR